MVSASQLFVLDQSNQLLWRMHLVKKRARYVDRNACRQNKLEMTSDNLKAASSTVSSVQGHHAPSHRNYIQKFRTCARS